MAVTLNGHGPPPPPSPPTTTMPLSDNSYTLLLAGRRSSKSSFARLLLDTSRITSTSASATANRDISAHVAKFVQDCASGYTARIHGVSVAIEPEHAPTGPNDPPEAEQPVLLHVIDTPALDFGDESALEAAVGDIVRLAEARFAESLEDALKAQTGDRNLHLCIYFLDPDTILPDTPPRGRSRADSISSRDSHHLDPAANAKLYSPKLAVSEIAIIKRLSKRINVLPVIARADGLTNDRLAAIKEAVRGDLAQAGIGFGIFDNDKGLVIQTPVDLSSNGHGSHYHHRNGANGATGMSPVNGAGLRAPSSRAASPPPTSLAPPLPRLPYALVSPEMYAHSDGVVRPLPSWNELIERYTPQSNRHLHPLAYGQNYGHLPSPSSPTSPSPIIKNHYVRSYRWGAVDVLDPAQSDFLHLRAAIFHHMRTLKDYTKQYLFERFLSETGLHGRSVSVGSHAPPAQGAVGLYPPPNGIQHGGGYRPSSSAGYDSRGSIHAHAHHAHPSHMKPDSLLDLHHHGGGGGGNGYQNALPPIGRVIAQQASAEANAKTRFNGAAASKKETSEDLELFMEKQRREAAEILARGNTSAITRTRSKKIGIACNFCRSRKLKCDGDRPACGQCIKRSNPCDYTAHTKRRARAGTSATTATSSAGQSSSHLPPNAQSAGSDDEGYEGPSPSGSAIHSASASPRALRGPPPADMDVDYDDDYDYAPQHSRSRARRQSTHATREIPPPPPPSHHYDRRAHPHPDDRDMHEPPEHDDYPRSDGRARSGSSHGAPHSHSYSHPPPGRYPGSAHSATQHSETPPSSCTAPSAQQQQQQQQPPKAAETLPTPMRSPEQPPKRKRGAAATLKSSAAANSTANGNGSPNGRSGGNYGPKIIACNFCRARKTKCDGIHPTCQSCARRNLPCNYVTDASERRTSNAAKARAAKAAAAATAAAAEAEAEAKGEVGIVTLNDAPPRQGHAEDDADAEDEVDQLQSSPAISHLALEASQPSAARTPAAVAKGAVVVREVKEADVDDADEDVDADGEVDLPEDDDTQQHLASKRQRLADGSAAPSPIPAGGD